MDAGGGADGTGAGIGTGTGAGTGSSRLKPWRTGRGAVSAGGTGTAATGGTGGTGNGGAGSVDGAGGRIGCVAAGGSGMCGKGGGTGGATWSNTGRPGANRTVSGEPPPACSPGTPKCKASNSPCSNSDTSSPQARRRWDGSREAALATAAAFDMLVWFIRNIVRE